MDPESRRELSDAEGMMWAVERDPWLSPNGGSLNLYDRPIDFPRFRRAMANAVYAVPRLRQHVVTPLGQVVTPHWETDRELDLDWHVRRLRAPGDGSVRALLDWTTLFLQDPYDRTRPLWQYVVLDDVADGMGAIAMKLHHVVTDGLGAVRLIDSYTTAERDAPEPEERDIDALLADEPPDQSGVGNLVSDALRRPLAAGRAVLDAITHPPRLVDAGREVESVVRAAGAHMQPAGSPLWTRRSRRRHAEVVSLPFAAARHAWKSLGGTLNDLFVTAVVEAAARYHHTHGAELDRLHITFIVSTSKGGDDTDFTPVPVDVPAGPMDIRARFDAIRACLQAEREEVHGPGPMAAVASVANLLPTPLVTNLVRAQAGHVDIATSNVPGPLGDSYVAGAKLLHTYVLGPVAGTASNITLYTTAGSVDVGLHLDPVAIADPGLLRHNLEAAFDDLLAAA